MDAGVAEYRAGHYVAAAGTLDKVEAEGRDRLLVLMERGMARQAAGRYEDSSHDFIRADQVIDDMVALSVTRDSASMVINDLTQEYQGAPFERTMIHTFNALNHLALGDFENAAVEARRIIKSLDPDLRKEYPDDAFSRFVAGLGLQMMDDLSNASVQYRDASRLARRSAVDDRTGRLGPKTTGTNTPPAAAAELWTNELVCFIVSGTTPWADAGGSPYLESSPGYAEIEAGGRVLGRSYLLSDVLDLAWATARADAVRKAAKTAARIVIKDQVAHEVSKQDDLLGALAYLILFALETPDTRHWSTLPRYLQVARVPCPPDLAEFDVVFRTDGGRETSRQSVTQPLAHRRTTFVSLVRDPPAR
jgi:hypothetical protein